MGRIDLSKYNIRTDLIIENNMISHITKTIDNIEITKTMKDGNYYTLSFEDITNYEDREKVGKHLENIIKEILKENKIKENDSCLIIGLGNKLSTPDSLGPKVLDNILVTAHLYNLNINTKGLRKIYAFRPSVMSITGIESSDIIMSLIKTIKPNFIIAIDSLAGRNIERINKTIQITDTGIHPGSGIGNNRKEISKSTLGIPVIAIGVPTVIFSSIIVYDTINYLCKHIAYIQENENISKLSYRKHNYKDKIKDKVLTSKDKENLLGLFGNLSEIEKQNLIDEVLDQTDLNLIVTPTEIDFIVDKLASVISSSINNALNRQITHY